MATAPQPRVSRAPAEGMAKPEREPGLSSVASERHMVSFANSPLVPGLALLARDPHAMRTSTIA